MVQVLTPEYEYSSVAAGSRRFRLVTSGEWRRKLSRSRPEADDEMDASTTKPFRKPSVLDEIENAAAADAGRHPVAGDVHPAGPRRGPVGGDADWSMRFDTATDRVVVRRTDGVETVLRAPTPVAESSDERRDP
jgi:hypothetical protein